MSKSREPLSQSRNLLHNMGSMTFYDLPKSSMTFLNHHPVWSPLALSNAELMWQNLICCWFSEEEFCGTDEIIIFIYICNKLFITISSTKKKQKNRTFLSWCIFPFPRTRKMFRYLGISCPSADVTMSIITANGNPHHPPQRYSSWACNYQPFAANKNSSQSLFSLLVYIMIAWLLYLISIIVLSTINKLII